jgi:spermidine synthase
VSAREFSYARRTKAHVEFVVGDGRLALEREPQRGYDVLALDAFSSDSIPMHLVTREAMAAYVKHLAPGGALVFQATNRFVDLLPVIRRLADEHGMQTLWIRDDSDDGDAFTFASDQVIVTADPQLLELQALKSVGAPAPSRPDLPTFTDDYHNLLRILHQRGKRPPQSQRTQPSSGSTERSASPAASVASQARGS